MITRILPNRILKTVFAVAALAAGFLASGGLHGVQHAAASTSYTVAVSFDSIKWTQVDDGDSWHQIQVYGSLYAGNGPALFQNAPSKLIGQKSGQINNCGYGQGGSPMMGNYPAYGACHHTVSSLEFDTLANVVMCTSTGSTCNASWKVNNNTIFLTVHPGEFIHFGTQLWDYDALSADDMVCDTAKLISPMTDAQLQTLNQGVTMSQGFNGDGGCTVHVTLKRV